MKPNHKLAVRGGAIEPHVGMVGVVFELHDLLTVMDHGREHDGTCSTVGKRHGLGVVPRKFVIKYKINAFVKKII